MPIPLNTPFHLNECFQTSLRVVLLILPSFYSEAYIEKIDFPIW
jgi:hypothetical protein